MSEKPEDKQEGGTEATTNMAELAKVVPVVYKDAIQPAAKEIGKSLETVAKAVNLVLAPVSGLVWGGEQLKEFISSEVSKKLQNTPEEEIITPKPNVAGPALEALRYTGHEESLRELYANLLAASMDSMTSARAHPAFVDILKQITPDEAKMLKLFSLSRPFPILDVRRENKGRGKGGRDILRSFSTLGEEAGCEHTHLTPSYLDNLSRLGIIDIPAFGGYTEPNIYVHLENHPTITSIKHQLESEPNVICSIGHGQVKLTQFGHQFISICVEDHAAKRQPKP